MNAFDSIIAYFAPQVATKRLAARHALAQYDGASRSERTQHWPTTSKGPNEEIRPALEILRARSRDLVRNNWAAQSAVTAWERNVVAHGIKPSVSINGKAAPELDALFREWALSTKCDADERLDLYGLQSLAMRTIVESGECILLREHRDNKHGSPLPFQIRLVEPDHLPEKYIDETKSIYQGVEFDRFGRRVAYHLFDKHPGDSYDSGATRYKAEDVAHGFRMDRPGQVRGVPWPAAIMVLLKDFDEWDDAHLVRQKIAACFSVFVRETTPVDPLGSQKESTVRTSQLVPGLITPLGPGEDVSFAMPPGVDGYAEYTRIKMHQIAAGMGIPYYVLTGDLTQVNYSSARIGGIEFSRAIRSVRDHVLFTQVLQKIGAWFLDAAFLLGYDTTGAKVSWTAPVRELLDPKTEYEASSTAIRSGLSTPQQEIRRHGGDPIHNLDEIQDWNKELDSRLIRLDSDPRTMGLAGAKVIEDSADQDITE